MPVAQEQILAREHRAESARSRKKQAAAEAAAGKSTVTGGNFHKLTLSCSGDQNYLITACLIVCMLVVNPSLHI